MASLPHEPERAFLNVEQSLNMNIWRASLDQAGENRALAMAQAHGLNELIARVLAARGVEQAHAADFLNPTIKSLMPDPSSLTDADKAANRLAQAIERNERVAIFGDYDVDGAASSALVSRFLGHFGVETEIYIPDRIFEGYGPNPKAIGELVERGASLIVTVDCGSTSHDALEEASRLGRDVIVLDHHQVGDDLPVATAVVNPNRADDLSGQGHLCAAGVVYLVLVATMRLLRASSRQGVESLNLLALLDLVALATVCDVVPLQGLNRAYVVKGLIAARHLENAGLSALLKTAGIGGPITPYHFGFLIGPRINAGGRIGDAALGSRLLTLSNPVQAEEIALRLEQLNKERQAVEKVMLDEAEAEVLAEYGSGDGPAIVVTERTGWHPGVVGLIAARLKEKLKRPAIAIAFDPSGKGTGSCRSIPGFDIGRVVRSAVDEGLLLKGGGHAMAAGLTVDRAKMGQLRAYLEERAASQIRRLVASHTLKIDGALAASGATLEMIDLLEKAGPYGAGHPQPLFVFPSHRLTDARIVGANHVKLTLQGPDGSRLDGISFRTAETPIGDALLNGRGLLFHFAGHLSADLWQGRRRVQVRLVDLASADM